jgi:hypothetical protein
MIEIILAIGIVLMIAGVAFLRRHRGGSTQMNAYRDKSDAYLYNNQNDMTTGAVVGGLAVNDALNSQPAAEDTKRWGAMGESSGSYDSGSSSSHDSGSSSSFDGGSSSVD